LDYEKFKSDYVIKNAISMCVLQIGELAGKLTDGFKTSYNEMPWRDIIAIRHRMAHAYENVDLELLWKTALNNIPELKVYCEKIIDKN